MSKPKPKPAAKPKRHVVKLADIACRELMLNYGAWSQADQRRLARMLRGMRWLDDEQARVRDAVEEMLRLYDEDHNVAELVGALRLLVKQGEKGGDTDEL